MERHLRLHHSSLYKIVQADKSIKSKPEEYDDKPITLMVKISVKKLKEALVEIITVNGRPFAYMQDSGLQKILRPYLMALPPELRFTVSAESIKNFITETANVLIAELKEELKNKKQCLKIDAVSRLRKSFLGINVQFIENDRVAIRTLAVTELLVRHTGVNLREVVMDTLNKYEINLKNVYTITSDNGSNMLKAGELIKEMQLEKNINEALIIAEMESDSDPYGDVENPFLFTEFQGNEGERSLYVIPCAAHVLQLVVEAFLKLPDIKLFLRRIRKIVTTLRNQNNLLVLHSYRLPTPVLEVATRWHSAVDMLLSFMKVKDVIIELKFDFNDEDWAKTEALITCLEPLKIATKVFESEQLLMGDFFGEWILCQETLIKLSSTAEEDEDMSLYKRLKNRKISTYATILVNEMKIREAEPNQVFGRDGITLLNNPAVVASVYLDPRYFTMLSEEQKDIAEYVLRDLYYDLNSQAAPSSQEYAIATPSKPIAEDSPRNLLRKKILERNQQRTIVPLTTDKHSIDNQLMSYRNSVILIDVDVNILEWWTNVGILKWPELYPLTRIVHASPATQVTVERLFSQFKFVFSQLRFNLKPERAEEIMLIRANTLFKAKELKRAGEWNLAEKILAEAEAFEKAILTSPSTSSSFSSPASTSLSPCSQTM